MRRRSKGTKKRSNGTATGKTGPCAEAVYSPQPQPPPPPSVPTAEKALDGSPITISSQKDLENLVSKIKRNSQPPSPRSTPPVVKANKRSTVEGPQTRAKRGKRKSKEEKDEDYVDTGEGSEDEEDSDFDEYDDDGDENEVGEGNECEKDGKSELSGENKDVKKRPKTNSKLPQAVRNRIAAQEFRQRQKTYIFELEQRVNALARMNASVCCRLKMLAHENSVLRYHLAFLRDFISKVSLPPPPPPRRPSLPDQSQTKPEANKV